MCKIIAVLHARFEVNYKAKSIKAPYFCIKQAKNGTSNKINLGF